MSPPPTAAAPPPAAPNGIDTAALARGDDAAIDAAFASLERGLAPAEFLSLVRALVAIGLGGLATSLLRTIGAPLLADPGIRALADQVERLPRGEIPLERQRANVAANLAALRRGVAEGSHDLGELAMDAEAILADPRPTPLCDLRGRTQLAVRAADGTLRLLTPFRLLLPAAWATSFGQAWPPFAAMSGVMPGHLVPALLAAKREGHLPAKVMAFEHDELALRTWLRSADLSEQLATGAIDLRFGPRSVERYLEAIDRSLSMPPVRCVLVSRAEALLSQGARDLSATSTARWAGRRGVLEREATERIAARTNGERLARFRDALAGRRPLVIAGLVSRHTSVVCHMMRDMLAVLAARGHETILMTEPTPSAPMVDLLGPLATRDVDLVLAINYLRSHPAPLTPAPLPYVCWMQDMIASAQTREAAASQGPLDLLVAPSAGFFAHRFGYAAERTVAAPNLTSWAMYGAIGDRPRRRGAPDVVYVGHGWESAETLAERQAASPEAKTVLAEATRELRRRLEAGEEITGFERMRIIARIVGTPIRRGAGNGLYWAVQSVFDRLFRHQALEWAARWCERHGRTMAIHGMGWERHPTLGRHARGVLENGVPLGELCRDAGVVLHANGNASLHQRLLDGVAAGGCVLTRRNPADDVPGHWRTICRRAPGASLGALHAMALADPILADAIVGFERALGCSLRCGDDPRRVADRQVIERTDFWSPEMADDAGLARHLTSDTGFFTPHGAADIAGFQASTYGSEGELGELLGRVLGDDAERDALRLPMRESVRGSFTMEWLAGEILARMAEMLERAAT